MKFSILIWITIFYQFNQIRAQVHNVVTCNGNACNNTEIKTTISCPFGQEFNGTACVGPISVHEPQIRVSPQCPAGFYFTGTKCQQNSPVNNVQHSICPYGFYWTGQGCTKKYWYNSNCNKCGSVCQNKPCGNNYPRPQIPQIPFPQYPSPIYPRPLPPPLLPSQPIIPPIMPSPPIQIPPIILPTQPPISSPQIPKYISPTYECDPGFQWNGFQCTKTVSIEIECPPEYNYTFGQCQHFIRPICPLNYNLTEHGQCMGETIVNIQCPYSYQWNGEHCIQKIPSCPPGYNLTDGYCQKIITGFCPPGTILQDNKCIYQRVTNIQCPPGYQWNGINCVKFASSCPIGYNLVGEKCVRMITSDRRYVCPDGTKLVGNQCQSNDLICPPNFTLKDNRCIIIPGCPSGFILQNELCVEIKVSCETGYYLQNNTCIQMKSLEPICPPNYQLRNDLCYPILKEPLPDDVDITNLICPEGTILVDKLCHPITNSITPICPDGFYYDQNICVELPPTTSPEYIPPSGGDVPVENIPLCPPGYQWTGKQCVQIQPTCPDGMILSNNYCYLIEDIKGVPPTCPENFMFENNACIPVGNPTQTCPPGYVLDNNACVIAGPAYPPAGGGNIPDFPSGTMCPYGYYFVNGACMPTAGIQPIPITPPEPIPQCMPGYFWMNNACHIIQTVSPEPPTKEIECSIGYFWNRESNECQSIQQKPIIPPIDPICPSGYYYVRENQTCNPLSPIQPIHPPIQIFPELPTSNISSTCTLGYYYINGTCIPTKPICPDGYVFYEGTCYLKPTPSPETSMTSTTENHYWTVGTTHVTYPQCPYGLCDGGSGGSGVFGGGSSNIDTGHNITNDIVINNFINNNNTVNQPTIVNTNNTNNIEVHVVNGGRSCSGAITIVRNNETIYQPQNCTYDDREAIEPTEETFTDDEEAEKCCEIITPRQCKQIDDEKWSCFHRKYQRCGSFCTQPRIYLKPSRVQYFQPYLIMPPPPPRFQRLMMYRSEDYGVSNCAGCLSGSYRCSNYCFNYDCDQSDCDFVDQDNFCGTHGGEECSVDQTTEA